VLNVDAGRLQRRLRATLPRKETVQQTDEQRSELVDLVTGGQSETRRPQRRQFQLQLAAEEPV